MTRPAHDSQDFAGEEPGADLVCERRNIFVSSNRTHPCNGESSNEQGGANTRTRHEQTRMNCLSCSFLLETLGTPCQSSETSGGPSGDGEDVEQDEEESVD